MMDRISTLKEGKSRWWGNPYSGYFEGREGGFLNAPLFPPPFPFPHVSSARAPYPNNKGKLPPSIWLFRGIKRGWGGREGERGGQERRTECRWGLKSARVSPDPARLGPLPPLRPLLTAAWRVSGWTLNAFRAQRAAERVSVRARTAALVWRRALADRNSSASSLFPWQRDVDANQKKAYDEAIDR